MLSPGNTGASNWAGNRRWCTGGFRKWIYELDNYDYYPYTAKPYNFAENLEQEYFERLFACEATASYSWTGTQCCGDDSVVSYVAGNEHVYQVNPVPNYQEYYLDIVDGCWQGRRVKNNSFVNVRSSS